MPQRLSLRERIAPGLQLLHTGIGQSGTSGFGKRSKTLHELMFQQRGRPFCTALRQAFLPAFLPALPQALSQALFQAFRLTFLNVIINDELFQWIEQFHFELLFQSTNGLPKAPLIRLRQSHHPVKRVE